MYKVNDKALLEHYIKQYQIDGVFESDMRQYMSLFCFERNECICKTREEMQYLYFHVKGKLKIYTLMENGKSLLLRFAKPLSVLGDVELLREHRVTCNVDSLNESLLIGIQFDDVIKFAYHDARFLRYIIQSLSYKLYTNSNSTSINLLYPLENRFASYILSIYGEDVLNNQMTSIHAPDVRNSNRAGEIKTSKLTEMATLLGTSYRHLCRIINELVDDKVIRKERDKMIILDYDYLKKLAGDNIYE